MRTDDPAQETEPLWLERPKYSHLATEKWTWALAAGLGVLAVSVALLIGHWKGF